MECGVARESCARRAERRRRMEPTSSRSRTPVSRNRAIRNASTRARFVEREVGAELIARDAPMLSVRVGGRRVNNHAAKPSHMRRRQTSNRVRARTVRQSRGSPMESLRPAATGQTGPATRDVSTRARSHRVKNAPRWKSSAGDSSNVPVACEGCAVLEVKCGDCHCQLRWPVSGLA